MLSYLQKNASFSEILFQNNVGLSILFFTSFEILLHKMIATTVRQICDLGFDASNSFLDLVFVIRSFIGMLRPSNWRLIREPRKIE